MTDKYDEMREQVYNDITRRSKVQYVSDIDAIKAIIKFSEAQEDFNQEVKRMFRTVQDILNNHEERMQHIEKYLSGADDAMVGSKPTFKDKDPDEDIFH